MVFSLNKKDPATRRALKTKLSFKSFGKYHRQIACIGIPLLQKFYKISVNKDSVKCFYLKAFPSSDNSQKIFGATVTLQQICRLF